MNPGFKYPIDENVLRNKLLHTHTNNIEQAWENFEHYLQKQKPICSESKKTKLSLMIPASVLFRAFLACMIILPSLLFYKQFNTKIPAALDKAVTSTKVSTTEHKKEKASLQHVPVQVPIINNETNAANKTIEPQLSVASEEKKPKHSNKVLKTNKPAIQSDSSDEKIKIPNTATDLAPKNGSLPQNQITLPQIEQSGELNEQL